MADLLPLVLAGHLLGDWVAQTDWQAANKVWPPNRSDPPAVLEWKGELTATDAKALKARWERSSIFRGWRWQSWRANQMHMLTYHLTMVALVVPVWHSWLALGALGVSWVSHSFIDRRWPVRWLMRHTGSGPFSETTFGVIAVDQALHLSILCILVALAT